MFRSIIVIVALNVCVTYILRCVFICHL